MPTETLNNDMLSALIGELLPALIQVESSGDDGAVGDNGEAVGCLQIHQIYVDDCNRILQMGGWTLERSLIKEKDRRDRWWSGRMTTIYLTHYGRMERVSPTSKRDWLIKLAKIHHGGPNGYKNDDFNYVAKVETELDK
jgi:hypothetical protein